MSTDSDRLDVLVFAAHPDDAELNVGGTIATLVAQGYRVGVADCTRGELGSRGTVEGRAAEAAEAARVLGLYARYNLGLPDGAIPDTPEARLAVIRIVRRTRPDIALVPPVACRHPDHEAASRLVTAALYQSGLVRIEAGDGLAPWRPHHVLHYMQTLDFEPTLVVDVTAAWEVRMQALRAYRSQFHDPTYSAADGEPETYISNPAFLESVEARARSYGHRIGVRYGEPFLYHHGPFGVTDLVGTFSTRREHR